MWLKRNQCLFWKAIHIIGSSVIFLDIFIRFKCSFMRFAICTKRYCSCFYCCRTWQISKCEAVSGFFWWKLFLFANIFKHCLKCVFEEMTFISFIISLLTTYVTLFNKYQKVTLLFIYSNDTALLGFNSYVIESNI